MENLKEILSCYVAFLRVLYLVHQNNHWTTKGADFYGNHLLFQRLYEMAQQDADAAAEKIIGLFGEECLDINVQMKMINKIMSDSLTEPLESSVKYEKKFLAFSKKVYDLVEKSGKMTLGLDDMIMSIANNHEESVYLLQQALKG